MTPGFNVKCIPMRNIVKYTLGVCQLDKMSYKQCAVDTVVLFSLKLLN